MAVMTGDEDLQRRFAALRDGRLTKQLLGSFGDLTVQYAKANAHRFRKTGNLERTIRVLDVDVTAGRVRVGAGGIGLRGANQYGQHRGDAVGYAAHVEYGTRPHVIRPRRKKALFFVSQYALDRNRQRLEGTGLAPGGSVRRLKSGNASAATDRRFGTLAYQYAKVVNHPGTRAQPYLRPAAREALERVGLADRVIRVWNDAA